MIEGKIYMIKSKNTDKVYIGSTRKKLKRRLSVHKCGYKRYCNGSRKYCSSYEVLKHGDYYIELLREVIVETKEKLLKLEGETISLYRTNGYNVINDRIAGRTDEQYKIDNKQKIKQYYEDNKVEIQKKHLKKEICPICKIEYTHSHKARHEKSKKHLSFII